MGGAASSKKGKSDKNVKNYNVESACFDHHYTTGDALGRGAFGVVKVCQLRPPAAAALEKKDLDVQLPRVLRRQRFLKIPLAVKIMRDEGTGEGDSVEKLEVQIQELEDSIKTLEQGLTAQDLLKSDNEELNWQHDYMNILSKKLEEKRGNRTKKTPRDNMLREVALLEKCDHRYIMQHVEAFEEKNLFSVVFERCYGSVATRHPNGALNESVVPRNGFQLISAVGYLHGLFILHRDIKPENLMYRSPDNDDEVVLGDFGMAIELRKADDRCQGCAGTPHFVPPEGFHSYYQSFPSDCWACGCTIYWMLLGECPFEVSTDSSGKLLQNGKKSIQTTGLYALLRSTRMGVVLQGWKPQFEQESTAALARMIVHPGHRPEYLNPKGQRLQDEMAINLLEDLLEKVPSKRLTAREALLHKWFKDVAPLVNADLKSHEGQKEDVQEID